MISREPLSAQAQPPRRPSGADKKQKPAKKQGGHGRSRNRGGSLGRSTPNSQLFAANQHCQTLEEAESSGKTVDGSLPERRFRAVLDEKCGEPQCQKMVRGIDLMALAPVQRSPSPWAAEAWAMPGVRHFTFFATFFTALRFPSTSSASRICLNSLRSALSTLGNCRSSRSSALTMVEPITTRANHL